MADRSRDLNPRINSTWSNVQAQKSIKECIIHSLQNIIIALETSDGFLKRGQQRHQDQEISIENLDIRKVEASFPICYRTAIAYYLKSRWQQPLSDVIGLLQNYLASRVGGHRQRIILAPNFSFYIEFSVLETGWIHCILPSQALAVWLSALNQDGLWAPIVSTTDSAVGESLQPPTITAQSQREEVTAIAPMTISDNSPLTDAACFPWQHLHARCCSYLAIAHQLGLITLNQPSTSKTRNNHPRSSCQQILSPDPIPWLTKSAGGALYLSNYGDLIHAAIALLDWPIISLRRTQTTSHQIKSLSKCLTLLLQKFEAINRHQAPPGLFLETTRSERINATDSLLQSQLSCGVIRTVQVSLQQTLVHVIGKVAPTQL